MVVVEEDVVEMVVIGMICQSSLVPHACPVLTPHHFICFCVSLVCILHLPHLQGYHAPLDLYASINTQPVLSHVRTLEEVNLCVGKEWYRVPSSFFLPDKRWAPFRMQDSSVIYTRGL